MVVNHQPNTSQGRSKWIGQGSRHARGYGSEWVKTRERILIRDMYLCQPCLRNSRPTPLCVKPYDHAVDHIIPKAKGGTDDDANLEAICAECHDAKSLADKAGPSLRVKRDDGW